MMIALMLAVGVWAGGPEQGEEGHPITELGIYPGSVGTEVLVGVGGDLRIDHFRLREPDRVVLDIAGAAYPRSEMLTETVARGGVREIRASQFTAGAARIVLELDRALPYLVERSGDTIRISLASPPVGFEPWVWRSGTEIRPMADEGYALPAPTSPPAPPPPPALPSPQAERLPSEAGAPEREPSRIPRISVHFSSTPIREVLFTFGEFSGRSIVPGVAVTGAVDAEIRDQPWDVALREILVSHGFAAFEDPETGIIRVDDIENLSSREGFSPLLTRTYRIDYTTAQEIGAVIEPLLSPRGNLSIGTTTNTVVVMDVDRVQQAVEGLIRELDIRTPMVTISAKIVFVNRTDLDEFGVLYDLKDSRGNQLNRVTPGAADFNADGIISLPGERAPIGTDVVSLGGSSIAALGNANSRVVGPSLSLLTSLVVGRHTLVNFIEALQSANFSEVEAMPQVQVLDNHEARILVGERTPIRVLDTGAGIGGGVGGGQGGGGAAGGGFGIPRATVQIEETGIVLQVTPHVTAGDNILLSLRAERSAAELADSDIGLIFRTQEAESRVLVEDGETVVIGGLTVTERTEVRAGIPLLMRLPLLGRFFRTSRDQQVQRDLIILVTPTISRLPGERS